MALKSERVSEQGPEQQLGSLLLCMVEGDSEQRKREWRSRRRAIAISIFLESAALTALILVPLFGKTERISVKSHVPVAPYGHPSGHARSSSQRTASSRTVPDF
jgi:hypothetical protein